MFKKFLKENYNTEEQKLIKIVENCRRVIMGSDRIARFGDCEDVSLGVAKSLIKIYPDIKVIDGRFDGKCSNKKVFARGHVWCFIPSLQMIIDGTQDQFNEESRINILTEKQELYRYYKPLDIYRNITRFFDDGAIKNINTLDSLT